MGQMTQPVSKHWGMWAWHAAKKLGQICDFSPAEATWPAETKYGTEERNAWSRVKI